MRALFLIPTFLSISILIVLTVFPDTMEVLLKIAAIACAIGAFAYACAEAYQPIHAYLKRRGIAE